MQFALREAVDDVLRSDPDRLRIKRVAGLPGQMKLMADLQTSTVLHVRGAMAGTGIGIKVTACDHLC